MITCTLGEKKYTVDFISGRALREIEPATKMYARIQHMAKQAADGEEISDDEKVSIPDSSIHTHGVRQKRGGSGKQITIGVKHSEKGAFYANPVEWGHGGPAPAPMHPFVRPAFDVRYPDACEEMKRVLRDALKP